MTDDHTEIAKKEQELEETFSDIRDVLIDFGESEELIDSKSNDWMLSQLSTHAKETKDYGNIIKDQQDQIDELLARPSASILTTKLIIDGETISDEEVNSVATIDGHHYFSDSLLNTFLQKQISCKW